MIWEGAEYRGRGRMTTWDGSLEITGNAIGAFEPINFWHLDKRLERSAPNRLAWESVTTGNFAGADIRLEAADGGELRIDTPHVKTTLALADIGFDDTVFEAGGLARQVRVFRLPDVNPHRRIEFERTRRRRRERRHADLRARDARERASGLVESDLPVPPTLTEVTAGFAVPTRCQGETAR